jgi:anti-anti-sigma regulatory factor
MRIVSFITEVPTKVVIEVQTINDELKDFDCLFQIWLQANQTHAEIILDFSKCYFLRQNAVAFLGGLIQSLRSQGKMVNIKWDTLHKRIATNLQQNGFMHVFNDDCAPWDGNSIPYREDLTQDEDCLVDYLKEKWLGKDWIHVGQNLQNLIVSRVYEIYANAFEHGQSSSAVFSCGQYYPNLRELKLTVVDFGVGIPSHVRNFQTRVPLFGERNK